MPDGQIEQHVQQGTVTQNFKCIALSRLARIKGCKEDDIRFGREEYVSITGNHGTYRMNAYGEKITAGHHYLLYVVDRKAETR